MHYTFIEILRRALDEELARDPSVHLLGEDVAAGGAFGVTRGLAQRHGITRVRNTPISEAAITGLATGAALCGLKPVLEIMFIDFATLAMDCLVNQAAKYRYMSGGQLAVHMVVRTQAGAAGGAAAQHSQGLEAWFIHVPGLIVVAPSTPAEAYGLLKSAIRLGEPVLFIEHKRLYTMKEELAEGAELPPIGRARIVEPGTDVTVIAYSAMVQSALEAAQKLADSGISAEVVDLRTLLPLDMATIAASVSKTHRALVAHEAVLNGGVGAEIAARIGAKASSAGCIAITVQPASLAWTENASTGLLLSPVTTAALPVSPSRCLIRPKSPEPLRPRRTRLISGWAIRRPESSTTIAYPVSPILISAITSQISFRFTSAMATPAAGRFPATAILI
jgi:pyruvate dehydrogenase E1 component beta subunit